MSHVCCKRGCGAVIAARASGCGLDQPRLGFHLHFVPVQLRITPSSPKWDYGHAGSSGRAGQCWGELSVHRAQPDPLTTSVSPPSAPPAVLIPTLPLSPHLSPECFPVHGAGKGDAEPGSRQSCLMQFSIPSPVLTFQVYSNNSRRVRGPGLLQSV